MTNKASSFTRPDPGDDSVVLRVHLRWLPCVQDVMSSTSGLAVGHIFRDDAGAWHLAFAVQRGVLRRQRHFVDVDPDGCHADRWGLTRLGPGVWDVKESIVVPGQIHAFVTLVGVPCPAPWENEGG